MNEWLKYKCYHLAIPATIIITLLFGTENSPSTLTVSPTKSLLTCLNGKQAGPTLEENGISS